jgi:hypothetical protein
MASAPNANPLPVLYQSLVPLSSNEHKDWKARQVDMAPWLVGQHAFPVTVDEFPMVQRYFPIIFTAGENPVPLALMGLNEGVNMFVDAEGKLTSRVYVPAYIRRYPFLLARLRPESDELSLCFDPAAGVIGDFEEGQPLFEDGQPTDVVKNVLGFCEQWEQSWQKTGAFVKELEANKLLIDGEVAIQPQDAEQPYIYRGFQMVDENKLRELRGDVLRKMNSSGLLPLVYAHLYSLGLMSELFQQQLEADKVPPQVPAAA